MVSPRGNPGRSDATICELMEETRGLVRRANRPSATASNFLAQTCQRADELWARTSGVNPIRTPGRSREREYGDNPAVDGRSRDAQLGEDRVDVFTVVDPEKQGFLDARIGLALSHLPRDVQLARSQGGHGLEAPCLLSCDQVMMISGSTTDPPDVTS